jgi:di/tricarboxylate transporter
MFCVMAGASASFVTPVGYQTNMMVWGPGGYKFTDFTKFGLPLSVMHMLISVLLAHVIWPFSDKVDWSTISL